MPFVAVGLGLTRLLPEPDGLSDETRFSASFGAGVKLWLGRHVGIRLEGRGFFTVLDSNSRTFCDSEADPHDRLELSQPTRPAIGASRGPRARPRSAASIPRASG